MAILASIVAAGCGGGSHTSGTSSKATADRLVTAGLAAQKGGSAAKAVKDFEAAVAAYPLEVYAYYDLGVISQAQGRVAQAATEYQKALLIQPHFKSALYNLAVLETPGSPRQAVADYRRLLTFDPRDPNVLLNLGLLERKLGDPAAAADLAQALQIAPTLAARIPPVPTGTGGVATTTLVPAGSGG